MYSYFNMFLIKLYLNVYITYVAYKNEADDFKQDEYCTFFRFI